MLAIGATATLGHRAPAVSDPTASEPAVVYCYDRDRDVVTRVLAAECRGRVVSDADAAGGRRDEQIKRAIAAAPRIGRDGLRIASLGTAFYVDETGRLLTNHHVVAGCKLVTILAGSGEERPVTVLAIDAKEDLALLQADVTVRAAAVFGVEEGAGRNSVIATVGYPNQGLAPREPLVTTGVLLGVAAEGVSVGRLVIRADIRRGNSGGPIFDDRGRVIGLVYAKIDPVRVYDKTHLDVEDTGLGIPLSDVLAFLRRNDARFRQAKGGDMLEPGQILSLAQQFVVRADCWK
jgi:S1-C subfamily serine protease